MSLLPPQQKNSRFYCQKFVLLKTKKKFPIIVYLLGTPKFNLRIDYIGVTHTASPFGGFAVHTLTLKKMTLGGAVLLWGPQVFGK